MSRAIAFRRDLHRHPELSGSESATAERVRSFFAPLNPDAVLERLGGHGIAVAFGTEPGPTVLLRCELDALPIEESNDFSYRSAFAGVSHKCGHDGHMAILAAVGERLATHRPRRGRVVLLFQPAEETGEGAAAVIADERFARVRPDFVFALHNLPGFPLGEVIVRSGTFSCASRGAVIDLHGRTAHAAQPELGVSPARAMCLLIRELDGLRARRPFGDERAFATVVGAVLGGEAFGTAPGDARVMATLRAETNPTMGRMVAHVEALVESVAKQDQLRGEVSYRDVFLATHNAPGAVEAIRRAAGDAAVCTAEQPFLWSEDFGRFTEFADGALFGLGAGEATPDLHNPAYDFPDALIERGAAIFERIVRSHLGSAMDS